MDAVSDCSVADEIYDTEKTYNKIENTFQKTMSKSKKRIFKTQLGVLKRICRSNLIWNDNSKKGFLKINEFFERVVKTAIITYINTPTTKINLVIK